MQTFEKILKTKMKVVFSKQKISLTATPMWQADMSKSKKLIKGVKFRSFEKGLRDSLKWFKKHYDR